MSERPWLTIVGLGEDGPEGLPPASLAALEPAEIIMGASRHLSLLQGRYRNTVEWPVPFADGIDRLLALRGKRVAVLVSGDPFWFGAGSVLSKHLDPQEWMALPVASCFSLAASRLGWPLERIRCLGLHAAPLSRLRPYLAPDQRLIVTLRDGTGANELARYLAENGFGESRMHMMEALGGPRERMSTHVAMELTEEIPFSHPICVAIEVRGGGTVMSAASGLADDWFEHDGQLTKQPVRAITLSALAPRPGEHLWDIGGGSGSVAIEWLLAHPSLHATSIEADPWRAERIRENAARLGVDRLKVANGEAPDALEGLDPPDAVFVGGGLSSKLLERLAGLGEGTRLVANGVTLETEKLLADAQTRFGGNLMRIEISNAAPLGTKRGWRAAYPIVQWSVTL